MKEGRGGEGRGGEGRGRGGEGRGGEGRGKCIPLTSCVQFLRCLQRTRQSNEDTRKSSQHD